MQLLLECKVSCTSTTTRKKWNTVIHW